MSSGDTTSQTHNQEDNRGERAGVKSLEIIATITGTHKSKPTTPYFTSELSSSSSSPCQHIVHTDAMTAKKQEGKRNLWYAPELGQTVNATPRAKWVLGVDDKKR